MVTEECSSHKKRKLRDDGDGGAMSNCCAEKVESATKKRSPEDSDSLSASASSSMTAETDGEDSLDEEVAHSVGASAAETSEECIRSADGRCKEPRHIHPCICDLSKYQRRKIDSHRRHREMMQRKYERRVKEIEEELTRLEEERKEKEREMQEQEELFGDEYELIGKKKKRKKRSARRASMVSLGVKQVINWRKQPKIEVKMTSASKLRTKYSSYCGRHSLPSSPVRPIDFHKEPALAVRTTISSDLRCRVNLSKKKWLIDQEDKRKRFETPYYV